MSNLRKRSSAQRTRSKHRQLVAAFNDMETSIERHRAVTLIEQSRFIEVENAGVPQQFLLKPPFIADRYKVPVGSEDERINLRYLVQNGMPRFSDRELGITLY